MSGLERTTARPAERSVKKTSIVHLLHTIAYGGVETQIIHWLRKIDREAFDVHLMCFANPGATEMPFIQMAARFGLSVRTIPWNRRKPVFKSARMLAKILREVDADVLHTHNVYADLVGLVASKMVPVRTVTTLYVWDDFGWKRNMLQKIDEWVIRYFDLISPHCEETLQKTLAMGFDPAKVKLLVCGFETFPVTLTSEQRLAARRARGIADDHVVLVNLARLYPEKNQAWLLRCFKEIHAQCPGARLWFMGVGPLEAELKELSTQLGLDEFVHFAGFVEDVGAGLALVDIQVHPSHAEGVALAVVEGMAAGLPIVATRVGGLPEVLSTGRGILTTPGDERGFIDSVIGLIRSPEERQRLGAVARRFIENEYSLANAVRNLEETYVELLR
jgi:glycosyltransferase involved in cell wall biosynthesis